MYSTAYGGVVPHAGRLVAVVIIALIIVGGAYELMHVNISALPEPGAVETAFATKAKDWYISRAARYSTPTPPPSSAAMVSTGKTLFDMGCANCHGKDGRKPTPIGQSMYPRVLDLSSPVVQRMSDRELFWIIKNGIRLSGMPGFGRIQSDVQIWKLTYYVRSLGNRSKP